MRYGLDVSSNNDHPINWPAAFTFLQKLGNGAQPFVIVKINEGTTYANPDAFDPVAAKAALADVAGARAAGFAVGGYLMDHGNADPASEEAFYHRLAGALPQFDDDELPEGLSAAAYAAHLRGLIDQAPTAVQYLNQSEVAEGFPQGPGLWLAEYNGQPGVTKYPSWIHQYTSSGVMPGVAGFFDLNAWTGTEAQFAAMFGTTPPPQPVPEATAMPASPLFSFRAGQQEVMQVSGGVLWHKNEANGAWANEAVAGPIGTPIFPTLKLTFPDQVPQVSPGIQVGDVLHVIVEDSSHMLHDFLHNPDEGAWGHNPLP